MADTPFSKEQIERAVLLEAMKPKTDQTNPLDQVLQSFPAQPAQTALSPQKANLLGNLVDATSTMRFLLNKSAHEANPLHLGGADSAAGVGVSMAAGMAGEHLLAKLLRSVSPKLADTLQSGVAAEHLGAGSSNLEMATRTPGQWNSFNNYLDALSRSQGR